jgi:replicative DNA helicase
MQNINAKIPPHSVESEQSLLGCILIDNKSLSGLNLPSQAMYESRHQTIFEAMIKTSAQNKPVDFVTLAEYLESHGLLEGVGGRSYLVTLTNLTPMVSHASAYAEIILEKYNRRNLIMASYQAAEALYDESKPVETTTEKLKLSLIGSNNRRYTISENPQMADDWLREYSEPTKPRIKFGMPVLDNAIGGLAGQELLLIIAKSNIGKTTLMLNMMLNMVKEGKKVLFFSLEMGVNELVSKMIAISGNHSAFKLYTREYQEEMILQSVMEFKDLPLAIAHRGSITSKDVMAEAHNRVLVGNVDVIMVDYLQRLNDESREGETKRLTDIARNLKNTANALGVPIIAPVQIDKASAKSGSQELEDIAGSKAIGDEGDIALYLYEKVDKQSIIEEGTTELHIKVAKARNSQKFNDFIVDFDKNSLKMTIR